MHVVFGGSGGLGTAVVRELVRRGESVRSVTRSGRGLEGAEAFAADGADVDASIEACQGAKIVYCCAAVPYEAGWAQKWPPLLAGMLAGAGEAGARFVMGDNLYMYAPPKGGKLHEDLPEEPTTRKGRVRAEMARTLREAHRGGQAQVVIVRASDFYGPGVTNSAMGDRVFGAAARGKMSDLVGDIDAPHSYAFIDDVARAMILLGGRGEALGQVWHAPHAPAVSSREFVDRVYRAAGRKPRYRVAPRWVVKMMGWYNPIMRELEEMLYQWEQPFVVDDSKFRAAFGDAVPATPLEEGIEATLAWYRGGAGRPSV